MQLEWALLQVELAMNSVCIDTQCGHAVWRIC